MSGTSVQLFSREISQATSSLTFSTRNSILETLDSILETRDSILETIEDRGSRDCQLTFERYCITSQDTETTQCLKEIVKKLTVKDSIYMIADAWKEASAESIFKAFSKLLIYPNAETCLNNSEMQTENIVIESMMENVNQVGNSEGLSTSDVNDRLRANDKLPTSLQLSDKQILASIVGQSPVEDESSDEEDESRDQ